RAYHISVLSSRIFRRIGVWDDILANSAAFQYIHLSDAGDSMAVQFQPSDLGTDDVGYVATHSVLVSALQAYLTACKQVTRLCPATVLNVHYGSEQAVVTLAINDQQRSISTKLVIAADGAKSPLRQAAGITTHGWKYWQSCITCRVAPEFPQQHTAYELFKPSGPFAILPLANNQCQIVWTAPHAEANAYASLDDETFLAELSLRYGSHMGKLSLTSDRYVFPVQLMQSDRYVMPRLALVGDAAHSCHPLGGQGLNMGIRDAAALAEVLTTAHQRGEDIGSLAVLKRYETWRKRENMIILGFTDLLDRVFSTTWWPIVVIRRLGIRLLNSVQPFKSFALRLMTGLTGRSPQIS
ncbi:MAG: FAD-dependent hydroxylase, partial [Cyanobacteria bacterium]|nr:FAD-dependent hydroxylase [Cyanobacteriota bacterium]